MATRALNDVALAPIIEADDRASREEAIAEVITSRARVVIDRVLAPYRRAGFALAPQDADDIGAVVALRLVTKLRAVAEKSEEAIESFDDYVAALALNAAHDLFRRRSPKRARLKDRLRYVLTRDVRLSLWEREGSSLAGLAAWRGRADATDLRMFRRDATARMLDAARPADAIVALLEATGAPVRFDDLVRVAAELWSVVDLRQAAPADAPPVAPTQLASAELRDTLRVLWTEICALPAPQRVALLLNLREGEEGNAAAIVVTAGVATLSEVAAALEMSVQALAEIWSRLPIEDRAIAERLGLTRQQVINLRKSARARLARRLALRHRRQ